MRRPSMPSLTAIFVLCLSAPKLAFAVDTPFLLLDLPQSGRVSQIAPALSESLAAAGLASRTRSSEPTAELPAAVLLYSGIDRSVEELGALESYVRGGGGLVYLVGSSPRHMEPAVIFLARFGVVAQTVDGPRRELRLAQHPVTQGVTGLPVFSANLRLAGSGLVPLIQQGNDTVAAAGTVGQGRLVILPLNLVSATSGAPGPAQLRLLSNACLWAAGLTLGPAAPAGGSGSAAPAQRGPSAPARLDPTRLPPDTRNRPIRAVLQRPRAAPTSDFNGAILVDILAADDNWDLLADSLERCLRPTGLPVYYLDVEASPAPLMDALDSSPRLLVIGSTRIFTPAEAAAVSYYSRLGGPVLGIAHATPPYTIRLVDFNGVFGEFGIAASLIRAEGPALPLKRHPIMRDVGLLPFIPWGLGIWSAQADAVLRAGKVPVLCAQAVGNSRVVVMDGKLLLVGTRAVPGTTSDQLPYGPLVENAIRWLLGEQGP